MADVKVQNQPTGQQREQSREQQQRGLSRRQEYYPSRELFGFSPFSMMRRLTEEMDRAFASTFGLGRGLGEQGAWHGAWSPAVEVRERDNNLEITAELPGLTKDDVKVECTDEGIVIEGEKRRESESEEGGIHRSERTYGHFYRMVPLPEGTDTSKVKAEFKNGVLQIQAPLSEHHRQGRQVPIT